MLIDTHAHLQFDPLNNDIEAVLERAKKEGVEKIIVVGIDAESSKDALQIAVQHKDVFASVGLHPQDSKKINEKVWEEISEMAKHEKVVAIGETGLDYFKMYSPKEKQKEVFKRHIMLANETGLPLIVHNRDADKDSFNILRDAGADKVVFHCYSSDLSFAKKLWNEGYMTSFTGPLTYNKNDELRSVVKECPMDKIMVETDCPYLAPQKYRGKTNEPSYVLETALEIARQKDMPLPEIAKIMTYNSEIFFAI